MKQREWRAESDSEQLEAQTEVHQEMHANADCRGELVQRAARNTQVICVGD